MNQEELKNTLESKYARKVLYGEVLYENVPEKFKEEVKKELKVIGKGYLVGEKDQD